MSERRLDHLSVSFGTQLPKTRYRSSQRQRAYVSLVYIGDLTGDGQFDFCSRPGAATDFEPRADALGPLAHARQSHAPAASRTRRLRAYATAVIADENA